MFSNKGYSVFVSTAHKDGRDEQAGTGDIDYARVIAEETNRTLLADNKAGATAITGLFTEEAVYAYVWEHAAGPNPALHVMINAPKTGYAFTPEGLRKFKEAGGRLVITAVEFFKYTNNNYRKQALAYLSEAERIIFLDELDKVDALDSLNLLPVPENDIEKSKFDLLRKGLKSSDIIPVPPTISGITKPYEERGGDILSFGMIRVGKGLAHIIKLAGLIQRSADPSIKAKKILVVGSVQEHVENNRELHKLMKAMYPSKSDKIDGSTIVELKRLLPEYQKEQDLTPALPIELYVDVPVEALTTIFNRCRYAFLPAYRGASLRNSSISSALAQQFVILTHDGDITPRALKTNGEHQHAMVLMASDSFYTYADSVLENLIAREQDPSLNANTLAAAHVLMDSLLREAVTEKHLVAYNAVIAQQVIEDLASEPKSPKEEAAAETLQYFWKLKRDSMLSDSLMKKMNNFDVRDLGERNYQNLLARLRDLEGPLTEESKDQIKANRKTGEILTLQEKNFLSTVLGGPWMLKHATAYIEDIQKEGNELLSVAERKRRTEKGVVSHTNPTEGHIDNVFFSFGPGDFDTARFLDHVSNVIVADFKALAIQKNSPVNNMWSSDHFYAYSTQQSGINMSVYGTNYAINYRLVEGRWVKECTFQDPDGTVRKQLIEKGQEIFTNPRLDIALVLLTIEKIRLLGPNAWQQIMQEKDLSVLQSIVHTFYHSGVHEVHKPVRFKIDKPGVTVQTKPAKNTFSYSFDETIVSAINALVRGNPDPAFACLENKVNVDLAFASNGISINFLGIAILSGNITFLKELLKRNVDLSNIAFAFSTDKSSYIQLSPIDLIVCISNREQYQKLFRMVVRDQKYDMEGNVLPVLPILSLLLEAESRNKINPNIISFETLNVVELDFLLMNPSISFDVFKMLLDYSSITARKLPIVRAAAMGQVDIVEDLLKRGADVNAIRDGWFVDSRNAPMFPNSTELKAGYTPLIAAVMSGNLWMCDYLVRAGAKVNQAFVMPTREDGKVKTAQYEGYTSLFFAVELGHTEIAEFLITHGADITHRSANGKSVFNIAENKQRLETLQMLESVALQSVKPEELDRLKKQDEEFIFNDNRFFYIFSVKHNGGRQCVLIGEQSKVGVTLFSDVSISTLAELKQVVLGLSNADLALGVDEDDFSVVELGTFEFKAPEKKLAQKANVVLFELEDEEKILELMTKIAVFGAAGSQEMPVSLVSKQDVSLFPESLGFFVKHNELWYSSLELAMFRTIIDMGDKLRQFTPEERVKLENQYQQLFATQHALVDFIQQGDVENVKNCLAHDLLTFEKVLVSFKPEVIETADDIISVFGSAYTPFEISIISGQYACAHQILDKVNQGDNDFGPILEQLYIQKIIRDGQLELYKKFKKMDEIYREPQVFFDYAVTHSKLAFAKFFENQLVSTFAKKIDFSSNLRFYLGDIEKPKTLEMVEYLLSKLDNKSIDDIAQSLSYLYKTLSFEVANAIYSRTSKEILDNQLLSCAYTSEPNIQQYMVPIRALVINASLEAVHKTFSLYSDSFKTDFCMVPKPLQNAVLQLLEKRIKGKDLSVVDPLVFTNLNPNNSQGLMQAQEANPDEKRTLTNSK